MSENVEKAVVKAKKERKLEVSSILPSFENSFTGVVNVVVLGKKETPLEYTYAIPEIPEFFIHAIDFGIKNRLSVVSGGKRDKEELFSALKEEIDSLKEGKFYKVKNPGVKKVRTFSSTIVALALLSLTKEMKEFRNFYGSVIADTELLHKTRETFEALTEREQLKLLDTVEVKNAKKAVNALKTIF